MSTQVKHRRGNTAEIENFTPAIGEIVVNTDDSSLVVGDGATAGGKKVGGKDHGLPTFDSTAELKATSLAPGLFAETGGYSEKGGSGAGKYLIKTEAEALADGDVLDGWGNLQIANGNWAILHDNSPYIDVTKYGAKGDGVIDDTSAIEAAVDQSNLTGGTILFPAGTYVSSTDKTIDVSCEVVFVQGATLSTAGAKYRFLGGISAGNYKIFETTDVFVDIAIPPPTSIKILGCKINAKWFCEFVTEYDLIKTIPDQTNNLMRAWRAGIGDWVTGVTGNAEYVNCVLDLGTGKYRVDKQIKLGSLYNNIYYRFSGGSVVGNGPHAAHLVRTDMANTDPILFCAFYTGELTNLNNFKISAFNPDGANDTEKFASAVSTLLFCQGDSLQINNIWCSGAQVPVVDAEGVSRNGVGIQISSAVDTYLTDVFIELCVTGLAIHSSIVSAQNIEVYTMKKYGLAIGNYMEAYQSPQNTYSTLNIGGVNVLATPYALHVLEGRGVTPTSINMSDCTFIGLNAEFGLDVGVSALFVGDDSKLVGSMRGCRISDFREAYVVSQPTAQLGMIGQGFHIGGVTLLGQTYSANLNALFSLQGSSPDYITIDGLSVNGCGGALVAIDDGSFIARGINISGYTGAYDAGGFNLVVSSGAPYISLTDIVRNINDTQAVNLGYMAGGEIRVDTPAVHLVDMSALSGGAIGTKATRETL